MELNKDLLDATAMVSFVSAVLVATTESLSSEPKNIFVGVLATIVIVMIILRAIGIYRHGFNQNM